MGVVWSGECAVYLSSLGVQLILASIWARPAILVAGKGRGGIFYFFCFLFLPCPYLLSPTISSVSFLPVYRRQHKVTHKGWHVVKPQHSQSNCDKDSSCRQQRLIRLCRCKVDLCHSWVHMPFCWFYHALGHMISSYTVLMFRVYMIYLCNLHLLCMPL